MKPKKSDSEEAKEELYMQVENLISSSKQSLIKSVNQIMVYTYFELGRMIVDFEQEGEKKAKYGKEILKNLSEKLAQNFGKGFSVERIKELSKKGQIINKPSDTLKDPYILEFIGLPKQKNYSESDLEQELIDKLEHFLLELGKGFTFVARQKRISFDEKHFKIDLVFYNRLLKCFVLIDLKIGELKHQDIGQIQMYVNYYDRFVKLDEENKTIGIILYQDKNDTLVDITLPKDNEQIFASKYKTILPSKDELRKLIEDKE